MNSRLGSQAGFSLVQMLMALGAFSAVALGIMQLNGFMMEQQRKASTHVQIDLVRRNLSALVLIQSAWTNTLNGARNAVGMACLRQSTPCTEDGTAAGTAIADRPFAIYDGAGTLYYDATIPTAGFNVDGLPCNSFNTSGNDECPLRFDLKWTATCAAGNCVNPQVTVKAQLLYAPASGNKNRLVINPARYSIDELFRSSL